MNDGVPGAEELCPTMLDPAGRRHDREERGTSTPHASPWKSGALSAASRMQWRRALAPVNRSPRAVGPGFQIADTNIKIGAPLFAHFAKGGYDAVGGAGFDFL